MRVLKATGLTALLLASAAGCADLTVPNINQPDQSRVIADAGDLEQLVANSYLSIFRATSTRVDLVLSTASFQHTATAANEGMIQYSKIPREPTFNSSADAFSTTQQELWYGAYAAISSAVAGLERTDPANPESFKIVTGGVDNTARTRAWARFVQGLSHGSLALVHDKALVYDAGDDPLTLEFQPYPEVMAEALAFLDSAEAITMAGNFTIPASWIGAAPQGAPAMSKAKFLRVINSYQAKYRASVARDKAERAAVDWNKVMSDASAGLTCTGGTCETFTVTTDPTTWRHNTHWFLGFAAGPTGVGAWAQVNNFIHGMADQSGRYQTWLSAPVLSRTPFVLVTPDKRFPQGATAAEQGAAPGKYINYGGTRGHFRPDRGSWRWSLYRDYRLDAFTGDKGDSPVLNGYETRLLRAEGMFRTGNLAGAADLINETRVANGGLNATNAAGLNTSCVPKLPNGSCGDLFEMLKWEKRMENFNMSFGAWFFDSRGWGDLYRGTPLQWPVPARELEALGLPLYNFGGAGGESSAPCSTYAWNTEC